jgi:hypothetical protein
MFKVRLCNFKATGISSRGNPPYCVRGNFDGKPFNTEYFHSGSMSPMWALDSRFDFHTPNIDMLANKYLLLECYGADVFIGMCRVDLYALATGPTSVELNLREGHRVAGTLTFEAFFEHVTNTTLQFTNVSLTHVAARGQHEDSHPCPYIALGFAEAGPTIESMVAPSSTAPMWERLPPLHKRCSYNELCDSRVILELKHARNGFSPGVSDPLMASFELHLGTVPIDVGVDSFVPVRIMVHSTPQYAFPFSTPFNATLEVRNAPKLVQLRGGLLTDSGVIGGVPPVGAAGLNVSVRPSSVLGGGSPSRSRVQAPVESVRLSPDHTHRPNYRTAIEPASHITRTPLQQTMHAMPTTMNASAMMNGSEVSALRAADIDLMEEVSDRQSSLLSRVHSRLQDVMRRRSDVQRRLDELATKEADRVESTSRRKGALEGDLRTALSERERIEDALRALQMRREEEARVVAEQAADRERMRRDLDEEQREVDILQNRVAMLRQEMERHLQEEQERYLIRVREAEESRRRAQQDAEEFAMIEARLAEAESRAARQQREHEERTHSRLVSAASPSRTRR